MKRTVLSIGVVLLAVAGWITLTSNGQGYANISTGDATGRQSLTCDNFGCHSSAGVYTDVTTTVEVKLKSSGTVVTEYLPDSVYEVSITVSTPGTSPVTHGMQSTTFNTSNQNVGVFSNVSSNARLSTAGVSQYFEHLNAAFNTDSVFTADWTAPAASNGDVTFYVSGIAANGAAGNSGDNYDGTTLVLTEGSPSAPLSTNANLSDLQVLGSTVSGFMASVTHYDVNLPAGSTSVPSVVATVADTTATAVTTDAATLADTTFIVVTAEDTTVMKTYSVAWNVLSSIPDLADMADIRLFPNPSKGQLNVAVNGLEGENIELMLISLTGSLIDYQLMEGGETAVMDTERVAPGSYLLVLRNGNGRNIQRVVVE